MFFTYTTPTGQNQDKWENKFLENPVAVGFATITIGFIFYLFGFIVDHLIITTWIMKYKPKKVSNDKEQEKIDGLFEEKALYFNIALALCLVLYIGSSKYKITMGTFKGIFGLFVLTTLGYGYWLFQIKTPKRFEKIFKRCQ